MISFPTFISLSICAFSAPTSVRTPINNQYIVVYKKNVADSSAITNRMFSSLSTDSKLSEHQPQKLHEFTLDNFKGFSIKLADSFQGGADELKTNFGEDVDYVEQDNNVEAFVDQIGAPWGLRRLSSETPTVPSAPYRYPETAGYGIDVYIIDTGIYTNHTEFQGRARFGANFSDDVANEDGHGHGTHVAGTVGSLTYGVAKNVSLIAVKVLNSKGQGQDSNVIAGIEWAAKHVLQRGSKSIMSVANISLGGVISQALDDAVTAATKAGLVFVAAAGNSKGDACNLSPGRTPAAITVAASDPFDNLASFSERGPCVDIVAPGVDILSLSPKENGTATMSGTSMAAPHLAGLVALVLVDNEFSTVEEVSQFIIDHGVKDKISGELEGAPNVIANDAY
jgi:cerevisin